MEEIRNFWPRYRLPPVVGCLLTLFLGTVLLGLLLWVGGPLLLARLAAVEADQSVFDLTAGSSLNLDGYLLRLDEVGAAQVTVSVIGRGERRTLTLVLNGAGSSAQLPDGSRLRLLHLNGQSARLQRIPLPGEENIP